ncbi:MAG: outer membrane lipoprotein-sorting protein [Spirochaetota bacterium]
MKRITIATLLIAIPLTLSALTAEEIIKKMELNQVHKTAKVTGSMLIRDRFGTKNVQFTSYSEGKDKMLIEFTSVEEKGQKILRTKNDLYLYYPDAEEIIRLKGAALRDSVLGSDFSYEDMTGDKGILDSYKVSLLGTEPVDGHQCYKLALEATERDIPYPYEEMWVDTELFVYRKVYRYSLSKKLLKEMKITKIEKIAGKPVPTQLIMIDTMKTNSSTEFKIEDIKLDIPIDKKTFSLEELSW